MPNQSQFGDTVLLGDLEAPSSAVRLTRVHFNKRSEGAAYDEAWLQKLIMLQPGLLPIAQIEPEFVNMVPVCTELPVRGVGFVDNLFITPRGQIALVECKLWRNPESRREVISQIIHYASQLTTWTYESLEAAVRQAKSRDRDEGSSVSLFEMVSAAAEMDEAEFHDAVSRNLKRGRVLLLIVGDGIREGIETMVAFLQEYAGCHFILSIIELALFAVPERGFIAQPRILAQTTNIERGVITLNDPRMELTQTSPAVQRVPIHGTTITQETFFADLERNSPGVSDQFRSFLADLEPNNVRPDFSQKTLTLRWYSDETGSWNLGTIVNSGEVWMDYHAVQARNSNRLDASKDYLEQLAALVPDASVKRTKNGTAWNIANREGRSLRIEQLLADDSRRAGWVRAIESFQLAIANSTEA